MTLMSINVLSINVARAERIDLGNGPERTAIVKRPVSGQVRIGADGLEGDEVGDPRHHGGPDQAVYVYTAEDYAHWEGLLDRRIEPGMFGENVTIAGFSSADVFVGDRLSIGGVVLEATAPRIPCGTFARRMGQGPDFVAWFRDEMRPGFYCRVVQEGAIAVGDDVELISGERAVAVTEMLRLWGASPDRATVERILGAPIAHRARVDYERKLERLTGGTASRPL